MNAPTVKFDLFLMLVMLTAFSLLMWRSSPGVNMAFITFGIPALLYIIEVFGVVQTYRQRRHLLSKVVRTLNGLNGLLLATAAIGDLFIK